MKTIKIIFFLWSITTTAQIKGNKEIETRTFNIDQVETIKINFYAEVIIDTSLEESITITTDTNLFDLIERDVTNRTLTIDQKEWIQPSQKVKLIIGAPNLKAVEQGTHESTKVINIDNSQIRLMALVGTIVAKGKTENLSIGSEVGEVDASRLIAKNAIINIWSWGTAKVNVTGTLNSTLNKEAKLIAVNTPKQLKGDSKRTISKSNQVIDDTIQYIRFKIKNNSSSRNHFFVVGPKPDGSGFGYGFPMMPQAIKKENWTTGTKVYKVNSLGFRKLLITIRKENEGQILNLF